ncbi:HAD family hydrolase [Glaciecola sp. HTCC2999]|uniref:HAD family hydrolase n=1 Tax=Glaciecola sp. HTCC2999 TaxID=455436 RepID=UPI0000E0E5D0|nr:HAD family hydrolase [Glaciecola sp. HTCC2999]
MQNINSLVHNPRKTVFFDLDGTLVHTDEANFLAYQKAVNVVLPYKTVLRKPVYARFNRNELRKQLPSISIFELKRITQLKVKFDAEFISSTHINQPVVAKLKNLRFNCDIFLITNASRVRAEMTLSAHNLMPYFNGVLSKNDRPLNINKYQHAIEFLSVDVNNMMVFENESAQIKLAQDIGIPANSIQKV